ncbi:MAG: hypothetical protein JO038_07290 [Alphaproteobacteria bacterium]|nr:hypothetical protein [Alphaproteobacteria bacterium]
MPLPALTPDELAALAALVDETIRGDRFPMSDRNRMLRAILAKLRDGEGEAPRPEPYPAPVAGRLTE